MSNECIIGKKVFLMSSFPRRKKKNPLSWLSIKWQMLPNQEERFLFPRVCFVPRYFCNQTLVIGTLLGSSCFLCKSTGITRCASSHHHRVLICPIYPPLQELSTGKERTPLGTTPIKNMDTLHPDISLLNLRVHTNVSKAK